MECWQGLSILSNVSISKFFSFINSGKFFVLNVWNIVKNVRAWTLICDFVCLVQIFKLIPNNVNSWMAASNCVMNTWEYLLVKYNT